MSIADFAQMCGRISGLITEALRLLKQINKRLAEIADLLRQIEANTSPKNKK